MQGRRRSDRPLMSRADRARYWAYGLLRVAWTLFIVGFGAYAIVSTNGIDDRAVERDAARTFQRCEQIEPVAIVVQLALDRAPSIRAEIRRTRPTLLDREGHLPVPDCRRIYPLGAAVSHRYPDLTPTKPAP
jgi:hypothetical protein